MSSHLSWIPCYLPERGAGNDFSLCRRTKDQLVRCAEGGLHPEQEIAEGCKQLIKNCIVCWNYLYLSQKLAETDDQTTRDTLLEAIASGSVVSWQHINLLGEYDFSEDKLQDTVGINPPRFTGILNRSDVRPEGSSVFVPKPV